MSESVREREGRRGERACKRWRLFFSFFCQSGINNATHAQEAGAVVLSFLAGLGALG